MEYPIFNGRPHRRDPVASDRGKQQRAELLGRPETLPLSLVDALLAIEDLAAPANWPRLEAAVYPARPRGLLLDPQPARNRPSTLALVSIRTRTRTSPSDHPSLSPIQ